MLEHAYPEIRTKEGQEYSQSSLQGFRAAVQRAISAHDRAINIFKDPQFSRANAILDGVIKRQKRDGTAKPVDHKSAITEGDMIKLQEYFANPASDPTKLKEYVWFWVTMHFCLRGCELQAQLTVEDLEFCKSSSGEYITLRQSYISKNNQGGVNSTSQESDSRIVDRSQVVSWHMSRVASMW